MLRYKILSKILKGQSIIGYEVLSENREIKLFSINDTYKLAYTGAIVNASYNKSSKGLSGINCDLRTLPAKQYSDIKKPASNDKKVSNENNTQTNSSDNALKTEIIKWLSMNKDNENFRVIPGCLTYNESGIHWDIYLRHSNLEPTIDIPDFITSIMFKHPLSAKAVDYFVNETGITNIPITSDDNLWDTNRLEFKCRYKITLLNGKNLNSINKAFNEIESQLGYVNLSGIKSNKIRDISKMFKGVPFNCNIVFGDMDLSNITKADRVFIASSYSTCDLIDKDLPSLTDKTPICLTYEGCSFTADSMVDKFGDWAVETRIFPN